VANLLEVMNGAFGSTLAREAAKLLGEAEPATKSAFGAALPGLLAGMIRKGSAPGGPAQLFDLVRGDKIDTGILDDVPSLLGSGVKTDSLVNLGGTLLTSLLGDKRGGLESALASIGGIRPASATRLLGLATPFVFSFLKKYVLSNKLDASGLFNLLSGQKQFLRGALDDRVAQALGLGSSAAFLGDGGSDRRMTEPSKGGGVRWLWWLLPLIVLLLLWPTIRSCGRQAERAASEAARETVDAAKAVKDVAERAMRKVTLPSGFTLDAPEGGFIDGLLRQIELGTFDASTGIRFDAVEFETGSATLTAASNGQLEMLARVLGEYPDLQVSVHGHTDNTGDPAANLALSEARAQSVRNALIAMGVDGARISAAGFGDTRPEASNDTEAGRGENRRVEVLLSK